MRYAGRMFVLVVALAFCRPMSLVGQGWSEFYTGLPNFNTVYALDSLNCWVCGDRLLVMKSTNGSSLTEMSNGLPPANYTAICGRGSSLAWVTNPTQIYKTTNGGSNWSKVYEYAGTSSQYVFYDAIYFWSDSVGIALSDQAFSNPNRIFVVRTSDGGGTWNLDTTGLPVGNGLYGYNGRFDVAGDHCWFAVQSGADADTTAARFLVHSGNRGATWESLPIPSHLASFAASFSDSLNGVIADGIHVARTTDGGKTWQTTYLSGPHPPIQFAKGTGTVWAGGASDPTYGALVAKSTDYGATWTTQTKPFRTGLNCISVVDQNYVWATGFLYQLIRTRSGGSVAGVGEPGSQSVVPSGYDLLQNYPNPFNPATSIKHRTESAGHIRVDIFDLAGREVRTLVDEDEGAGWHLVIWDGRDNAERGVSSGVYFYTLRTGAGVESKKMILLK